MTGARVLVVGGTGHLGRNVVRAAIGKEFGVRALVRPDSDAAAIVAGAQIVRGDLLDRQSLDRAVAGCDAVIATAIGYSNRRKGDAAAATDTEGNRNLIDAARAAGVGRFVFCSILTCDRAPAVPHFWNKKLTEDYLEASGLPFVALRPGAFLDQGPGDFWAAGLRRGNLSWLGRADVPLTFVHTSDLADFLVRSVDIPLPRSAARIDIGCDRPVSLEELGRIFARLLGRSIKLKALPWPIASPALRVAGLFNPWQRDLRAMLSYIQQGHYVADTSMQRECFGDPPGIERSVGRYLADIGLR